MKITTPIQLPKPLNTNRPVIASETKQSRDQSTEFLDCFVSLAMTGGEQRGSTQYQGKPLNFERWLQTPTKQNSGDEYYWQHQTQLQQSNLHFDPKAPTQRERKEVVLSSDPFVDKTLTDSPEKTFTPLQSNTEEEQITKSNSPINYEQITKITTDLKQGLKQLLSEPIANQQTVTVKQTQTPIKINSANYSPCFKQEFKNHHLYVQGNEVELTLNTTDLKPQEQKALKQMLNNHIKEKGLILNTLIINGVTHD